MQRSRTTSKTSFTLPDSDGQTVAIFDFDSSIDSFNITVPTSSAWKYWYHWQDEGSSICDAIECLGGSIMVLSVEIPSGRDSIQMDSKGAYISFPPNTKLTWGQIKSKAVRRRTGDLVAKLHGDVAFHRNICSAILDRDRMAFLASTPILLRLLLSFLGLIAPSIRGWILDKMLAIQLRMTFYAHGFWVYHGTIPFLWWWTMRQIWGTPRVPDWAYKLNWQFQKHISYFVQGSCYWIGRLFLGMKALYPEYTPEPVKGGEV